MANGYSSRVLTSSQHFRQDTRVGIRETERAQRTLNLSDIRSGIFNSSSTPPARLKKMQGSEDKSRSDYALRRLVKADTRRRKFAESSPTLEPKVQRRKAKSFKAAKWKAPELLSFGRQCMPVVASNAGSFDKLKLDEKRKIVDTFVQEHRDLIATLFESAEDFDRFGLDLVTMESNILTGNVSAAAAVGRVNTVRAASAPHQRHSSNRVDSSRKTGSGKPEEGAWGENRQSGFQRRTGQTEHCCPLWLLPNEGNL